MPGKPSYVVHSVAEEDVTVDWFFSKERHPTKVVQSALVIVGWFFAILPEVVEGSAIANRDNSGGWWNYREGFVMFDTTMRYLGILMVVFILGYFALFLVNRSVMRRRNKVTTYDEERLTQRLDLADDLYASKYGPRMLRLQKRTVRIEPYADVETYELRDRYRTYGVG